MVEYIRYEPNLPETIKDARTKMEYERVRKEIADIITTASNSGLANEHWADRILSLVEIRADDQSLPKYLLSESEDSVFHAQIYRKAQQDMLKLDSEGKHWIRVTLKGK